MSIGFGSFLFAVSTTNVITCNLESANESAKSKVDQKKILQYLSDFIQLHADVKKLVYTTDVKS